MRQRVHGVRGLMVWLQKFVRPNAAAHGLSAARAVPFGADSTSRVPLVRLSSYRPENVGNDASARPFERANFEPPTNTPSQHPHSHLHPNPSGTQAAAWLAEFDREGFLSEAKSHFLGLQAAWDRADVATLRSMMTETMAQEINPRLSEREQQSSAEKSIKNGEGQSDVLFLDAHFIGVELDTQSYVASVEFSGMIREAHSAGASAFHEVWSLVKPTIGANPWRVAGVQALQ